MNNHLPVFGIGPYLIGSIAVISVISVYMSLNNMIPCYRFNQTVMTAVGIILICLGAVFWLSAVLNSKIEDNVKNNQLVTTGIYAIVRHPIYAAFLYAITGFLIASNNLILLILPVLFWIILTVTMIKTEEKWLLDLHGDDYIKYSKKVNRFIPKVI